MMNCAYHTENIATVNCNGCGKPLCAACDHRIKGFPYCQNCIVDGVELLRTQNRKNLVPAVRRQSSPWAAIFLSLLCPGLGAAYNGQTSKGLVQFLIFIGLFQLAASYAGMPFFVLGFIGFWLYSALDSWRTAQLIRAGLTPNNVEDLLLARFSGNARMWGGVLIAIGVTLALQTFLNVPSLLSIVVLPLLLVGLGIHLIRAHIDKNNVGIGNDFNPKKNQSVQYNMNSTPSQNSAKSRF